jgi:hypothetical protein
MSAPPRSIPSTPISTGGAANKTPPSRSVPKAAPFIVASLALVILVGTVLALGMPPPNQAVAAITDAPSPTTAPVAVVPSPLATPSVASSVPPTMTPTKAPEPTTPRPKPTDRVQPAPDGTPRPYPEPNPTPKPDPTPDPTPPKCEVVDLSGLRTNKAQSTWTNAGFTGTVFFNPDWPPHYTITAQSIAPGDRVRCSSDITVTGEPDSPTETPAPGG